MAKRPVTAVLVGVLLILLGLWDSLGCLNALGALVGNGDTPDSPMLSAAQNRAMREMMVSASAYDPVNGALAALITLVGPMLIATGILILLASRHTPLLGRVACAVSIVVDGIQAVWGVIWYLLVWDPMVNYVRASANSIPDRPSDVDMGTLTTVSIVTVIVMGLAYYGVKMALAAWGFFVAGRTGEEDTPEQRPPVVHDPDLGWAD